MAVNAFVDTTVLVAGLIDFGPQSAPAQSVLHAVAEKAIGRASTACTRRSWLDPTASAATRTSTGG